MTTQNEYILLQQPVRHLHIKITLFNEFDLAVGSFEGIATGGSITLDADSTYRRSGSLEMVLDEKYNLIPSPTSKIWFNKRIGINIGLTDFDDEIIWFKMGRFAISNIDLSFSLTEKKINCELLDYMAFLDGTLGGTLSHETRVVAQSTPINTAILTTLGSLGRVLLDTVEVNGSPAVVPMDIEMPSGSTVYDLIKQLSDLYKNYTFFFNEDGYFRLRQIRNRKNDPIVWDFTDIDLSIDYTRNLNFSNVKNSIWVWGKQLDNGIQIVQNYRNRYQRSTITERDAIVDMQINDICYVTTTNLSYLWNGTVWEDLSFSVVSQFRSESIGEKIHSFIEENIYTPEQAALRCEYELNNYSNWAETLSFNTVPIYSLKTEEKIYLKIDEIGVDGDYLVKSISFPLDISGASSIQAEKIYY